MRAASTSKAFYCLIAVAALGACAEAGGEVKGGGLTEAGVAATTAPEVKAAEKKLTPAPCNGTGTRWTDLYNDIFGPTGAPGSCTFQSNCHGPGGGGARSLAGVQCFDMKGCRQSFLDRNLVTPKDMADPEDSNLLKGLLRRLRPDGTPFGFMPEAPEDYVFSETCVERMKAWIREGMKDD